MTNNESGDNGDPQPGPIAEIKPITEGQPEGGQSSQHKFSGLLESVFSFESVKPTLARWRKKYDETRLGKASRRTQLLVGVAAVLAVVLIIPLIAFGIAYSNTSIPRPEEMKVSQIATIYAADGQTVLSKIIPAEGNRTLVALNDIPQHVRDAVLSAEDRTFYDNRGFSIGGFIRAARDNVLGRENAGGGSTITQQYVKNTIVGNERSISRKLREFVAATKMTSRWSKEEVLEAYLNTIYFGRGAYGVAAAAQAYFGKPLAELDLAQGAVLAAVIRTPSSLDPVTNPSQARARWSYVMNGLVDMKKLSQAERDAIGFPDVIPIDQVVDEGDAPGPQGLIRRQVLAELAQVGVTEQQVNTMGVSITTTIDPKAQAAAESAAHNLDGEPENLRTAVVSIDPRSGAVRGYFGGWNGIGLDFAQAPLQTGSSFKVFGLIALLKHDRGLGTRFDSGPLTVHGIKISNVEGESCGTCTVAEALKRSLNTSFYRLTLSLGDGGQGAQEVAQAAHEAGIPEHIPGVPGISLAQPDGLVEDGVVLGQYQTRPIDMASAYGTIAASGMYHKPHFVQRVVAKDGTVLYERPPSPGEQRIAKPVAENVIQAMLPIASYSRGHGLAGGRPSAAKTGTAQLGDTGLNKDAWMVGFTPSLSTAVWVGTENGDPIETSWGGPVWGSGLPSDIWKDTMDGALADTDNESFPWPAPVGGTAGVPQNTYVTQPKRGDDRPSIPDLISGIIPPSSGGTVEIFPGMRIQIPSR